MCSPLHAHEFSAACKTIFPFSPLTFRAPSRQSLHAACNLAALICKLSCCTKRRAGKQGKPWAVPPSGKWGKGLRGEVTWLLLRLGSFVLQFVTQIHMCVRFVGEKLARLWAVMHFLTVFVSEMGAWSKFGSLDSFISKVFSIKFDFLMGVSLQESCFLIFCFKLNS